MSNMVNAVCTAVMVVVAFGLSAAGMVALILRRAVALAVRRAGSGESVSAAALPLMGQQLLDPAVQLHRQPGEHVLEIGPRLVPVELGRLRRAPNNAEWACLLR